MATLESGDYTEYSFDRGSIIAEYDKDEQRKTRYTRGYDLISRRDKEGSKSYYLHNAHGDVTKLVDSTGNLQNSYSYDAFGNTTAYTEQVDNRFRYAGEQYDTVTGQYYLRARYYDPGIGRFTQEDTYRGDGLNLYAYVSNNPVRYIDPSGHRIVNFDDSGVSEKCNEIDYVGKDSTNVEQSSMSKAYTIGGAAAAAEAAAATAFKTITAIVSAPFVLPTIVGVTAFALSPAKHTDPGEIEQNKRDSKNEVEVPKNVQRQVKKLSPEAKKGFEKAIEGLENGDTQRLNEHPLSGDRSGEWAVDIKGTGKGRGAGRVIYEKGKDGVIRIIEIIIDHKY